MTNVDALINFCQLNKDFNQTPDSVWTLLVIAIHDDDASISWTVCQDFQSIRHWVQDAESEEGDSNRTYNNQREVGAGVKVKRSFKQWLVQIINSDCKWNVQTDDQQHC